MHAGGTREIIEHAADPLGGGDDGFLWFVAFGDLLAHGPNTLACRGVFGWSEQFIEAIDHGPGLQIAPARLRHRRLWPPRLDASTRRNRETAVRAVRIERRHSG